MPVGFTLVPAGAVASGVFIENKFKRSGKTTSKVPQRIALMAQYLAAKTPTNNLPVAVDSADAVAAVAGYGSLAHMMAVHLFAAMGATPALVDWFPIADGTTAATGQIEFATTSNAAGTWTFKIAGTLVKISVASGDTPTVQAEALEAAINANLFLPVTAANTAGVVALAANWKGVSGNGITVSKVVTGEEPGATTATVTAMASGAGDPAIATALANMGTTNYTWVLTGYNTDTTADEIEAAGDARINPVVKKPFESVMGYTDTRANFITALASRNSPWTCLFPVEGSPNHPGQIAASIVGICAVSANADPGRPFKTMRVPNIEPGTGAPWTWAQQDAVEVLGGSTFDVIDGAVYIHDLLTTYTTNSSSAPDISWRWVSYVTNTQQKLYDLDVMLRSEPFDRAVIVDDESASNKEYAVSPKTLKTYLIQRFTSWDAEAWSFNLQGMIDSLVVEINVSNPARMDVEFTDYVTSPLGIIAVKRNWAFAA